MTNASPRTPLVTVPTGSTAPEAPPTPAPAPAAPAAAPIAFKSLVVYPPAIKISAANDLQHISAVATRADGITVDVSDQVQWKLENPAVAKLENLVIYPLADGATQLVGSFNGMEARSTLEITQSQTPRVVGFERDVMPIFTKVGCNTGSCHGAARGKDGFRLSLFGFDPLGDYQRITREIGIRRINLAVPDQSLLLLKATGSVQHSGGKKIEPGSKHHQTVLAWLQAGAPADAARPPAVTKVDLYPTQMVLEGEGAKQRLVAVATYADGTQRDVWDLAGFTTNNERTGAVDPVGTVTSGVRGEAFVMARFDTHTVGTQVLALPAGMQYEFKPSQGNYIDALVDA
ncbi:MAG: cell surface protein, partial [Pirellula sp.]